VLLARGLVEIGQHDVRALAREARTQGQPDAARAAGHDTHLVPDVHGLVLSRHD
jgi:hypothetical protein